MRLVMAHEQVEDDALLGVEAVWRAGRDLIDNRVVIRMFSLLELPVLIRDELKVGIPAYVGILRMEQVNVTVA